MKIFDYTDGKKGALLGHASIPHAAHGWLVQKGDKVFKVELANPPSASDVDWSWRSGALVKSFSDDGKFEGEVELKPEDFGVEAICYCVGEIKMGTGNYWEWSVHGTTEWNRAACKSGILKATFVRNNPIEARSLTCAKDINNGGAKDVDDIDAMIKRYDADKDMVRKFVEDGVTWEEHQR